MTVKIVTDSLSDITANLVPELGISVVPVYVRFGDKVYKDRIEMTTDEFYYRLTHDLNWPSTTQPTPNDFLQVYNRLAEETDEILVINLSRKLSGTYESALAARRMMEKKTRIEVIDSETVVMGLGTIVIAAAKLAKEGASLDEVLSKVQQDLPRSHAIMFLDTLKYLAKGGRIGRAQGLLGSMLSIKPILTIHDGEVAPLTRVRARQAGIDYLCNFVTGISHIEELAVEHATTPEDADALVERLGAIYPKEHIHRSTVSPVIGTYVGPHVLSVSVLGDK
ncbi:MAG: DegV family protein [Chloroflexota bacterium]